jgi:hypothetical protein
MMRKIVTIVTALIMTASLWAQAPEKISYQAVLRDVNNALITTQEVGMKISILQDSPTGALVYAETQNRRTNINGLVSLKIGAGRVVSGNFSTIDWATRKYFIKTETDPTGETTYTITGTSQLMSVPYALHAKTADSITGTVNYRENDPVYTAWNKSTGISITESQISNLTHTTNTHIDAAGINALGFVAEKTYTIGLWPELGGYVFLISADGKHGLVAETIDQHSSSKLDYAQNNISDSENHSPDGKYYFDWRLPTGKELTLMHIEKNQIFNFTEGTYWCSTPQVPASPFNSWVLNISNGVWSNVTNTDPYIVRAIRAF